MTISLSRSKARARPFGSEARKGAAVGLPSPRAVGSEIVLKVKRNWVQKAGRSPHAAVLFLVVASVVALCFGRSSRPTYPSKRLGEGNVSLPNGALSSQSSAGVGTEEEAPPSPLIPRRMFFTYKYNLLARPESEIPSRLKPHYNNVLKTIAAYREAWNDPEAEAVFLDDDTCVDVINGTEPRLLPLFSRKKDMYRADICRVVALYVRGGYYFDIDMEVIAPYIAERNVSFVTARAAYNSYTELFQSFLAASPGNLILKRSMDDMLAYSNHTKCRRQNLGPCTLKTAYESVPREAREGSALLTEAHARKINYTEIPPHGTGTFCPYVVHDPSRERVHFYSRIVGSNRCKS